LEGPKSQRPQPQGESTDIRWRYKDRPASSVAYGFASPFLLHSLVPAVFATSPVDCSGLYFCPAREAYRQNGREICRGNTITLYQPTMNRSEIDLAARIDNLQNAINHQQAEINILRTNLRGLKQERRYRLRPIPKS
jgi:hypothetical protein